MATARKVIAALGAAMAAAGRCVCAMVIDSVMLAGGLVPFVVAWFATFVVLLLLVSWIAASV